MANIYTGVTVTCGIHISALPQTLTVILHANLKSNKIAVYKVSGWQASMSLTIQSAKVDP